ncbi:MAG TPA: DNA polymerase III subunit delta [Thermaerobacter sp.]
MEPREVLAAIEQGRIQPVYLLHGPEPYWKDAIIRKLREHLLPAGDSMNLSVFDDGRVPVRDVLEQATTVPFLAERRLVIVRNSQVLEGRGEREDEEALRAYLDDPVTTTCLVFRQDGDVDGRRPLIKRFRERGYAVDCQPLRDAALAQWLQEEAARLGKTLRPEAAAWLVESGEPDLYRLSNELHKAAAYAGERREITGDDVRAVGIAATTAAVFDLVDAIAEKRRAAAVQLLGRLLAAGEPPLRLLSLIARQFRILAHARLLMDRGATYHHLQERLGLHPFVARKAWQQARRLGQHEGLHALEAILETDVAIKQGKWPERLALERLVLVLTAPPSREPASRFAG